MCIDRRWGKLCSRSPRIEQFIVQGEHNCGIFVELVKLLFDFGRVSVARILHTLHELCLQLSTRLLVIIGNGAVRDLLPLCFGTKPRGT